MIFSELISNEIDTLTDSLRNVRVKFGVMLSPHVGWGNKKKRPAGQVRVAGVHTNVFEGLIEIQTDDTIRWYGYVSLTND